MFIENGTTFRSWVLLWFEQKSTMHTDIGPYHRSLLRADRPQVKAYMIASISKL